MNGVASIFAPNMLPSTLNLTPLPSPWTEHIAPTGHYYYYNPITTESTYIRPISLTTLLSNALSNVSTTKKKKKKEKPLRKQAIPDTPWLRVVTNRGNVFYANKDTKESTWDVPQGLEEALAAMGLDESDEEETAEQEEEKKAVLSPSGAKRKLEENETTPEEERRKRKKLEGSTAPKSTTISMEDVQDEDEDEEAWQ
ncbi:7600_t:CDS:1, partial [Acaulospora colombiana]